MTDSPPTNFPQNLKQQLHALVPAAFKDGQLDIETLQNLLGSEVALHDKHYGLHWLGKSYARLLANENIHTWLKADAVHNAQPGNVNSQNLLIKGDNLEVLKHLMGAYSEQIKMIYIDPPYNTGGDGFVYKDDRKFTVEQLSSLAGIDEDEAKRILEFTTSKSNSHSAWLTFMYPRLYVAKQLLRDDGVIFISIDDNEQAQLKILCDEVFGEENFIGFISVENNPKGRKNSSFISVCNDYCFIYAKNKSQSSFIENVPKNIADLQEDENGSYVHKSGKRVLVGENSFNKHVTNLKSDKHYSVYYNNKNNDLFFKVENHLSEIDKSYILKGYKRYISYFNSTFIENTYTKDTLKELYLSNALEFKNEKIFEKNFNTNIRLKSIITNKEYDALVKGSVARFKLDVKTTSAGQYLKDLFNTDLEIFSAPKSIGLIKLLTTLFDSKDFYILDFFAGSGTTADALMQLNVEDKGNRQFISVQIDEITDVKSDAYKAGYKTIFDITKARLEKAAAKIKADNPLFAGDLGFKLYETVAVPDKYQDTPEELTETLELFDAGKLSQADLYNLMRTWALQDNVPLTQELTPIDLEGYTAYQAKHILYFIKPNITLDAVIRLLEQLDNNEEFKPSRLVVFGYFLDSKIQREMTEAVKHYNNRKGIELTLDIRY